MDFVNRLAGEFKLRPQQVQAAVELLDAGNTIPFIARYRKEATGSLDDQVLRELAERLEYLRNLEKRREEIASSLEEQGVLTDELKTQLAKAVTLSELEDIYRPFRPKRRTRATVAKERGLEPLALWLMLQQAGDPAAEAAKYINPDKEVPDAETALAGARDILAETVSDSAESRKELRALLNQEGVIRGLAEKESCVIIGHCGGYILEDMDQVIRVFVHAPMEFLLEQAAQKKSLPPAELEKYVNMINRNRADYFEKYTGRKWYDARNYDLCLNSGKLGFEKCKDIIKGYMSVKFR